MRVALLVGLAVGLLGCRIARPQEQTSYSPQRPPRVGGCGQKLPLKVHFFDVGQALAVLVELPGGETILVDSGESPTRQGCGSTCKEAHEHLVSRLSELLHGRPISLVWITHQHSDHLGGAEGVFERIGVRLLVDNGTNGETKQVGRLHRSAAKAGVEYHTIVPGSSELPVSLGGPFAIAPVVPPNWPTNCAENNNECSIGLRIDYCQSSILFTGDAEKGAEAAYDVSPVTLLQAGHHGSDTSSSSVLLAKVRPKYVVISSGKPGYGTNKDYCHPRVTAVRRLSDALGPSTGAFITAFDGSVPCKAATDSSWILVPVNDRLFSTARDGDVTLVTTGDGAFVREIDDSGTSIRGDD